MKQESISKLNVFSQLLEVDRVYLWHFNAEMELIKTNCPDPEVLLYMFRIGKCAEQAKVYFAQNQEPVILSDSIGLLWLADCLYQDGTAWEYYVIGPIFASNLQDQNFSSRMETAQLSNQLQRETLNQLNAIPVIRLDLFLRYGSMLHQCITGNPIEPFMIRLDSKTAPPQKTVEEHMKGDTFHGTWHYEQYLLKLVRDGDLSYAQKLDKIFSGGQSGMMCPGDPLRQTKDEIIVLTALVTRASVEGGIAPDTAYTLSDYYIQMVEAAQSVNAVYAIMAEMLEEFVNRVHAGKKRAGLSQLSIGCIDYVDRHVNEKIQISDIASSLGYADYYLTSKFKKDTGINLRDYICQKKVEQARLLLSATKLSVQQISDRLSFSSASYFCVVFQKFTGMTPGDFRLKGSI